MLSSPRVGYRRLEGQPVHRRGCACRHGNLVLLDTVTGNSTQVTKAFLHFYPAITVQVSRPQAYRLTLAACLIGCISYQLWPKPSSHLILVGSDPTFVRLLIPTQIF